MSFYIVEVDNDGFKIYDSGGTLIDPAKDSSVQSVLTALNAIKDTDGIKKIVDALPAGSNVIGKVDQGSAGLDLWKVDGSGVTQPISAVSLPLPAGAATEATLLLIKAKTDNIPADPAREGGNLATLAGKDFATQTTLAAIKDTDGIKKITDPLPAGTNNIGDVDVVSSALPTGAATESTLVSIDGKVATDTVLQAVRDRIGEVSATPTVNTLQDRLKELEATLTSIDGKDFATQTTLASVLTKLTEIDTILDSIKDTDGIKKITDQLPAGTNEIGKVAQGARAVASGAWPLYVTDQSGNVVGVILNNSIYRLENRSSITSPDGVTDADVGTLATSNNRLSVASRLTDGVGWLASIVVNAIRRLEARSSITSPDGVTDADVGALATANNRLSVASRLTDGTGWLSTILNNSIRRLEGRNSITAPDGSTDVAVHSIDGVQHLAAGKVNLIDSTNSTTAQLGPAGVFAPVGGTEVLQFSSVAITIHSDKDSAFDGMVFEFSMDGTNWDDRYKFNLIASQSTTRRFQFPVCAKYFRVNYTNGSITTTELRIQTILQRGNILTSIHRSQDVVREDRSAQLVKSVIIAQKEGAIVSDFYPVKSDISGNLKVTTIGTDIPSDPGAFILKFLVNGSSSNLLVDGSVTPVNFEIGPTVTNEVWSVRELLLIFTADDFNFDGLSFGPNTALTNGTTINVVKSAVSTTIFTVKQNEDFLRVPGRTPLVNNTGPKDVLGAAISFQGLVLNQSTNDKIRVAVNDNLTSIKLKYYTATVFAVKVV